MTITADRLRAVRTSLEVDGIELRLSSSLWRSAKPGRGNGGADGQPLIGVIDVETVDGAPLPTGLSIAGVWLANGDEVWKPSELEPRAHPDDPSVLEVVARGGPPWAPNEVVDVVARLEDAEGARRNLRAPEQRIRRVP
jgi:hypothetical protein